MIASDLVKINAKTTIKNEAANLGVSDYIVRRSETELLFANAVHDILRQNVMVEAPVKLFKMGEIHLPESVIETSLESAIAIQNNELLLNTQAVEVVRSETNRLVAEIDAETSATLQFAVNDAERIVEKAKSYANQVLYTNIQAYMYPCMLVDRSHILPFCSHSFRLLCSREEKASVTCWPTWASPTPRTGTTSSRS